MQKWEYKTVFSDKILAHSDMVDLLNKFGEEGWELVTVFKSQEQYNVHVAYLKRPKQ